MQHSGPGRIFRRQPGGSRAPQPAEGARNAGLGLWFPARTLDKKGVSSSPIVTPFRVHYERCRGHDLQQQLEECADYLHHPEVLVAEFLESYYQVEGQWQPSEGFGASPDDGGELVLDPFYASLELCIREASGPGERVVCVSGATNPLRGDEHPALSRRGLDYIAVRAGEKPGAVILGVVQAFKEETPYLLLLRALNCLAELTPPFQVVQLAREVVRSGIPENAQFDLQVAYSDSEPSAESTALCELCRDLAEAFARGVAAYPLFAGTLGSIECVELERDMDRIGSLGNLRRIWRV